MSGTSLEIILACTRQYEAAKTLCMLLIAGESEQPGRRQIDRTVAEWQSSDVPKPR